MDKDQNIVKKSEIYESLRSKNLGALLLTALGSFAGIAAVVLAIKGEINVSEWYDYLAVILLGGFGIIMLIFLIYIIKGMFTPSKSTLFERFGDAENVSRIISIMNKTKMYEDYNIIVSQDYIMEKDVYGSLLKLDDVRRIYIRVHKVNYVTSEYGLVLCDKYGEVEYKYERRERPIIEKLIMMLKKRCPTAQFGYLNLQNIALED